MRLQWAAKLWRGAVADVAAALFPGECRGCRRPLPPDAPVAPDLHAIVAQRQAADAVLVALVLPECELRAQVMPRRLIVDLQLVDGHRLDAQRERQPQLRQRPGRRPARARRAPHDAARLEGR